MKVVHISNFDSGDGPSNAAYRLHKGLLRLGHESVMLVAEKRTDDPAVIAHQLPLDVGSRVRRVLRRLRMGSSFRPYRRSRPDGFEMFSDDRTPFGDTLLNQLPSADVINVHTIRLFADYEAFYSAVPRHTVVVRTLHDMNTFTGGCHTDEACGRYMERCGACPQLGSRREEDLSREVWKRKRAALNTVRRDAVQVVAPSRWLADAARRSSLLRDFSITVIPFGLDIEDFRPRDRDVARETLGIPRLGRAVLFVAEPVTRRVKGFGVLAEALNGLSGVPDLCLISMGSGKPAADVNLPHLRLGHVRSDRLRSLVYSAADVLALPSIQENFPLTALEALACGTPVIGSKAGGIPEIVRPDMTGVLVPAKDANALRDAISGLLDDAPLRARMAATCRRIAIEEFALDTYVQNHVRLYEAALAQ